MARHPFGGGPDAVVTGPDGAVIPGATVIIRDLAGQQITDLQTPDGTPIQVVTADQLGRFTFLGPDGVQKLIADWGHGRVLLHATDLDETVDQLAAATTVLTNDVAAIQSELDAIEGSVGQSRGLVPLDGDGLIPRRYLPPFPVAADELSAFLDVEITEPPADSTPLAYSASLGKWTPGRAGTVARVANPPSPLIIASRTGEPVYPANSLAGAAALAAAGIAVDVTCNVTADGVAVCTVNPIPGGFSITNPESYYYAALLSTIRPNLDVGVYDTARAIPTLDDILRVTGGRVIVTIECQSAAAVAKATQVVLRRNREKTVIIQSFTLADLAPAAAAGIPCMLLHTDGVGLDPAALLAAGIQWVGLSTAASADTVADLIAGGLRVAIYTIRLHTDRELWLSRGVHALFTAEPVYFNHDTTSYRLPEAPFAGRSRIHGLRSLPNAPIRTSFTTSGHWFVRSTDSSTVFVLQGWACPLPRPQGPYSIVIELEPNFTHGADPDLADALFAIALCCPTDNIIESPPSETDGYHLLVLHADGELAWRRYDAGVETEGPAFRTPSMVTGALVTLTIIVTPTELMVERDGSFPLVWSEWDITPRRGPYFFVGVGGHWEGTIRRIEVI